MQAFGGNIFGKSFEYRPVKGILKKPSMESKGEDDEEVTFRGSGRKMVENPVENGTRTELRSSKRLSGDVESGQEGPMQVEREAETEAVGENDCLSYIFIVSEYKDYTFDYDDMAGYLHYIQLQFSIGPSEGSWRSKETYFQNQRTLIHRIFSVKTNYQTRFQKSGICVFILCALSATRNCVFSCQKEKKR